jgi:hypothetical protein
MVLSCLDKLKGLPYINEKVLMFTFGRIPPVFGDFDFQPDSPPPMQLEPHQSSFYSYIYGQKSSKR